MVKYLLTSALVLLLMGLYAFNQNDNQFGATDCTKITLDSTFKTKTKAEKMTQLETKIWQDIKRNEIPELDLNIVSIEEYTQAYANLANEKNATQKDNLFEGLRDKVVEGGIECK